MKKQTRIVSLILAIILALSVFITPVSASTSGAVMRSGIDYSGNGTVVTGTIHSGVTATVSGNYIYIPIDKGMYEASSKWGKWTSNWSTSRAPANPDLYKYTGDTTTEYEEKSQEEHQYKRYETVLNYDYLYTCVYQGTKWYNILIGFTKSEWGKYPDNVDGYKIVARSIAYLPNGTKEVMVYDSDWRTSAPFRWLWEDEWEIYNTRTTYKYRSRTLTWNSKGSYTTEKTPLKYSLNPDVSTYGIKLTFDKRISDYSDISQLGYSTSLSESYYFITAKEMQSLVKNELKAYYRELGASTFADVVSTLLGATDSILQTAKVYELNPYLAIIYTIVAAAITVNDTVMTAFQKGELEDMDDFIELVKDNNITLVIRITDYYVFSTKVDFKVYPNGDYYYNTYADTDYYPSYQLYSTTKNHVSLRLSDNNFSSVYLTGTNNFGTVSYITTENEIQMVNKKILQTLQFKYPLLSIWNYILK